MSEFKQTLITCVAIIAAAIFMFIAGQKHAQKRLILPQEERVDTLFIRDTIISNDPVFITKTKIDSIPYPVPVTDTLWKTDTIWLQREQVVWQDSLSCVYASGILPQVDSVHHYIRDRIVTKELTKVVKKPCKWSVGVHAGYGAFANNGQISASPYIGVGVSYNLFSW